MNDRVRPYQDTSAPPPRPVPQTPLQSQYIDQFLLENPANSFPSLPANLFHGEVFSPKQSTDSTPLDQSAAATYSLRLEMAADYINDALHGRNLQVAPTSTVQRVAQAVHTHLLFEIVAVGAIVVHIGIALLEDPTDSCQDAWSLELTQLICQGIYVIDIAVGLTSLGPMRFLKKKWNLLRVAMVLFMISNWQLCVV